MFLSLHDLVMMDRAHSQLDITAIRQERMVLRYIYQESHSHEQTFFLAAQELLVSYPLPATTRNQICLSCNRIQSPGKGSDVYTFRVGVSASPWNRGGVPGTPSQAGITTSTCTPGRRSIETLRVPLALDRGVLVRLERGRGVRGDGVVVPDMHSQ